MTPSTGAAALKRLLDQEDILVVPGAYDGASARLVADAGFSAAYLTGAGVSVAAFGLPDIGLIERDEMTRQLRIVRDVSDLPVVADADTGYGSGIRLVRTAQEYAAAGAAAIQLEDQVEQKRCGHLHGKNLVDELEFIDRMAAAREGAGESGMLLLARTDAISVEGFDRAIARALRYVEHGADAIFVEAPESVDQMRRIPQEIPVPTVFNLVEAGRSPAASVCELQDLGYAAVIAPGVCLRPAVFGMKAALDTLRAEGQVRSPHTGSPSGLFDLMGLARWEGLDNALKEVRHGCDPD